MRRIFLILLVLILNIANAQQEYPLTSGRLPKGSYRKDMNNELKDYEGTWKGEWNGKTITIVFKKLTKVYIKVLDRYEDYLIGKFQVRDKNGNILFDNLNISDENAKIEGILMTKNNKYGMSYSDYDLCGLGGFVDINFIDGSKTKIKLYYMQQPMIIDSECVFHNKPAPEPLPDRYNLILTKQ